MVVKSLLLFLYFLPRSIVIYMCCFDRCYQVCDGGVCWDACKYLTGGDVIRLDTDSRQGFFEDVVAQLKKKSYVSTSVRSSAKASTAKSVGLVVGHACKELPSTAFRTSNLADICFVLLRACADQRCNTTRNHHFKWTEATDAKKPSRRWC